MVSKAEYDELQVFKGYCSFDDSIQTKTIAFNQVKHSSEPRVTAHADNIPINFLIDTGAPLNVIDRNAYDKLGRPPLAKSETKYYPYHTNEDNQKPLSMLGEFNGNIRYANKQIETKFVVINGTAEFLLSCSASNQLKLINFNISLGFQCNKLEARGSNNINLNAIVTTAKDGMFMQGKQLNIPESVCDLIPLYWPKANNKAKHSYRNPSKVIKISKIISVNKNTALFNFLKVYRTTPNPDPYKVKEIIGSIITLANNGTRKKRNSSLPKLLNTYSDESIEGRESLDTPSISAPSMAQNQPMVTAPTWTPAITMAPSPTITPAHTPQANLVPKAQKSGPTTAQGYRHND